MVFRQSKEKQRLNARAAQMNDKMNEEEEVKSKLYNLYKQRALELEKAATLLQPIDGKKECIAQFLIQAAECTEQAADLLDEQCAVCLERINELVAERTRSSEGSEPGE